MSTHQDGTVKQIHGLINADRLQYRCVILLSCSEITTWCLRAFFFNSQATTRNDKYDLNDEISTYLWVCLAQAIINLCLLGVRCWCQFITDKPKYKVQGNSLLRVKEFGLRTLIAYLTLLLGLSLLLVDIAVAVVHRLPGFVIQIALDFGLYGFLLCHWTTDPYDVTLDTSLTETQRPHQKALRCTNIKGDSDSHSDLLLVVISLVTNFLFMGCIFGVNEYYSTSESASAFGGWEYTDAALENFLNILLFLLAFSHLITCRQIGKPRRVTEYALNSQPRESTPLNQMPVVYGTLTM